MTFTRKFLRRQSAPLRRKIRRAARIRQRYETWRAGKVAEDLREKRRAAKAAKRADDEEYRDAMKGALLSLLDP